MPQFKVLFETRRQGAIGDFEISERTVTADNARAALDIAMTLLHQEGYETRFPRGVYDEEGKPVL